MASSSLLTTLLLLSASLAIFTPSCFADDVLFSGDTMYAGQSLQYGNYILKMQTDCNLVLYDGGKAVWGTGTNNKGSSCNLHLETDGNLVIYDGSNRPLWASNTSRDKGHYVLVLQHDRNVVIYGGAVWASGTNRVGTDAVLISGSAANSAGVVGDNIPMLTRK